MGPKHGIPKWEATGYVKKDYCEKCNYKSKHPEQFNVYHVINLIIVHQII